MKIYNWFLKMGCNFNNKFLYFHFFYHRQSYQVWSSLHRMMIQSCVIFILWDKRHSRNKCFNLLVLEKLTVLKKMITICKFKQFMFVETVWFNFLNILYFICKLNFLQSIFKLTATIHVSGFYLFVVIWLKPVYKLNLTERICI